MVRTGRRLGDWLLYPIEIASVFASKANFNSRYKRLQRFFKLLPLNKLEIASFIFSLFFADDKKVYLILDRTNWYYGKNKLNVLVLSVAYEGLAIPICWSWLNKGGNSKSGERIELIKMFTDTFGKDCIAGLLGDREFIGKNWVSWLVKENIPFYFRIKNGNKVSICNGKSFKVEKIFANLKQKENKAYINYINIYEQNNLLVSAGRSERGELLIVVTNADVKNAVAIYLRRWEIENLFKALKSGGFNFEDTHITKIERIDNLMAVVSIAFCWAHKIGEWRADIAPIRLKIYSNKHRYQETTYFRYGLNWVRELLTSFKFKFSDFKQCLVLLFSSSYNNMIIKEKI